MSKSSSGKAKETLPNKIKNLLGISKGTASPVAGANPLRTTEFFFTSEVLRELSSESPTSVRLKKLTEICEIVQTKKLEENAIEVLWLTVADLLYAQSPQDSRSLSMRFLQCLIVGQYEELGIMRAYFFKVIQDHDVAEDVVPRFDAFKALCDVGKDVYNFEEEVGSFILGWMGDVMRTSCIKDFLALLVNLVKYNATYLDQDIVSGIVHHTCNHICWTNSQGDIEMCIKVLDAIVCYSYLPTDSLSHFINTLCTTVNISKEDLCKASWELMRKLLGTHLGHSAIYTMCRILQDPGNLQRTGLLRGAVFYIGMALWGHKRVESLKNSPSSVLPSFKQALQCQHQTIAYEVLLSVSRLVKKYGSELQLLTWDLVMDIVERVLKMIESKDVKEDSPMAKELARELHELLTCAEEQSMRSEYAGDPERLYDCIEQCYTTRPEESVLRLINHRAQYIHPMTEGWIVSLAQLIEKYFRHEKRSIVRVKVLRKLQFVLNANKHLYEEDLLENAVLPFLSHIEADDDVAVRNMAVVLLVEVCLSCQSKRCSDLLDIINKICMRPFENRVTSFAMQPNADAPPIFKPPLSEADLADVKAAVVGVIDIFIAKYARLPSAHAVKAFELLVGFMQGSYAAPLTASPTLAAARGAVLRLFCSLRSDTLHRVCVVGLDGDARASPYLLCHAEKAVAAGGTHGTASPAGPRSPTVVAAYDRCRTKTMSVAAVMAVVVQCLASEHEWSVLSVVLGSLPAILQNKSFVLATNANFELLCGKLVAMATDKRLGYPDVLRGLPPKFSRSDFQGFVYPILAALASYHAYVDKPLQVTLIKSLEEGRLSKCACMCVNAIIVCMLEMQETMMRQLPEVLLKLSQISATRAIAIPMLEFLACLIHLPRLYANFVEEQYMSVFAIAAPYTNPAKFSHYTASLAHQVIALWFIKCRIIFRKDFVRFITKGLKANVLLPFEEQAKYEKYSDHAEEVTRRPRSGSFISDAKDAKAISPTPIREQQKPIVDEAMSNFHMELTETCLDMMARYTFALYSSQPQRSSVGQFLLDGGQNMTWLVGNKLVTITTSGGSLKMSKQHVCEKCATHWQTPSTPEFSLDLPVKEKRDDAAVVPPVVRRRHRSAVTHSTSDMQPPARHVSQDDMQLGQSPFEHIDEMSFSQPMVSPIEEVVTPVTTPASDDPPMPPSFLPKAGASSPWKPLPLDTGSSASQQEKHRQVSGPYLCNCWCQDWAEVVIRRPTGVTSWMMRIQNKTPLAEDFSLSDISNLFALVKGGHSVSSSSSRPHSVATSEESSPLEQPSSLLRRSDSDRSPHRPYRPSEKGTSETDRSEAGSVSSVSSSVRTRGSGSFEHGPGSPRSPGYASERSCEEAADFSKRSLFSLSLTEDVPVGETAVFQTPELGVSPLDDDSLFEDVSGSGPLLKPRHSQRINSSPGELSSPELHSRFLTSPPAQFKEKGDVKDDDAKDVAGDKDKGARRQVERIIAPARAEPSFRLPSKRSSDDSLVHLQKDHAGARGATAAHANESDASLRMRQRGHTVSVMGGRRAYQMARRMEKPPMAPLVQPTQTSGINPAFVFLQLYHSAYFMDNNERPLLLPHGDVNNRAVKNLDRIPPYETHKIGVLYVGAGQVNDEAAILSNEYGSSRYAKFLKGLGELTHLRRTNPDHTFLGGLETDGSDGEFAYSWRDDITQAIFHVATLMPNKASDVSCNGKKLHIGNNFVSIVYNDSNEPYKTGTIRGQFRFVSIIIKPLDHESNMVSVCAKEELSEIGHGEPKIISDRHLPILARQLALHADLASKVYQSQQLSHHDIYASKWLERLRQIKRIRSKVLQEGFPSQAKPSGEAGAGSQSSIRNIEDFTTYL